MKHKQIKVGQYYKDGLMMGVVKVVRVYKTVPWVKVQIVAPMNQLYLSTYLAICSNETMKKGNDVDIVARQVYCIVRNKMYIRYLEEFCTVIPRLRAELIYETEK